MKIFLLLIHVILFSSISYSHNVGISVPSPTEKLDVNGNINLTGTIKTSGASGQTGQALMTNSTGNMVWGNLTEYKFCYVHLRNFGYLDRSCRCYKNICRGLGWRWRRNGNRSWRWWCIRCRHYYSYTRQQCNLYSWGRGFRQFSKCYRWRLFIYFLPRHKLLCAWRIREYLYNLWLCRPGRIFLRHQRHGFYRAGRGSRWF